MCLKDISIVELSIFVLRTFSQTEKTINKSFCSLLTVKNVPQNLKHQLQVQHLSAQWGQTMGIGVILTHFTSASISVSRKYFVASLVRLKSSHILMNSCPRNLKIIRTLPPETHIIGGPSCPMGPDVGLWVDYCHTGII